MFNIEQVFESMAAAVIGVVNTNVPQVKAIWLQYAQDSKDRLQELANARISNDITNDELLSYLQDEKNALKSQLLAVTVLAEAIAQQAANQALDIFWAAVNKVIGLKTT